MTFQCAILKSLICRAQLPALDSGPPPSRCCPYTALWTPRRRTTPCAPWPAAGA